MIKQCELCKVKEDNKHPTRFCPVQLKRICDVCCLNTTYAEYKQCKSRCCPYYADEI